MKAGTPKRSGKNLPSRANCTAVVIMKPQPIANKPQATGPFSRRELIMVLSDGKMSGSAYAAIVAISAQPMMLPIKVTPNSVQSPLTLMNPAVPVYSFSL